ncbi:MAG: hypothetical protein KDD47_25825, partial [Acidobacteria bacterium]|nr:hypothetical protein [Acidobacteriota bacterium]
MTQLFEESSSNLGALPGGTAVEVSEQGSRFEPGDIPSAIAGAAEELLGWYPEIPIGGESEGRARPRVWRGKKTVGKGGLRPPGAFLHQLALTLRLAAWAAIFKRFSPEPVAGILIAVGLAFGLQGLPTRSRRVGALRFWLPMVLSIPVEAAVLTLVSRNYLVPRYPETWLRFLLLAVAVLLAARCLDLAGVWLEMRKRVAGWRWARVPEPDLTVSRQGTPEAIAIVPRARSRFRRMPKPEKVEQFS